MKKAMVGILILIPILILVIVAMVSNIVSMQAWISVEDLLITEKGTERAADTISLSLDAIRDKTVSVFDYVDVKVLPEKANKYTIEWKVDGNVTYTDEDYQERYAAYLVEYNRVRAEIEGEYPTFSTPEKQNAYNLAKLKYASDSTKIIDEMTRSLVGRMSPAVAFVGDDGFTVDSNSTGKFVASSYCNFTVKVVAENVSKTLSVSIVGDNVERVTLGNLSGEDNNIKVGQSRRLVPTYTPIDSIVNHTVWQSDKQDVATVDQNGVVKALKAGSANITVKASVHSTEKGEIAYVESGKYTINVTADGASSVYGDTLYTAARSRSLTLAQLGLSSGATAVEGCTISGDEVTITAEKAVIATQNGNFVVYAVEDGAIAIENASFFENKENGYVLAVGDHTLKLSAVLADQLATSAVGNVTWTSSDTDVATVSANGEVKGIKNGYVTVTATADNGKSASITLNVRNKLASLQLRTSDSSLAVGMAKETVFASERYKNGAFEKEANFMNVVVQGEPRDATEAQLADFYESYKFEIVSGGEYAHFDTTVANKLVFDSALEGKKKQNIVVRVSARYPKHEGMSKFTTEEVTITAVYGVSVSDIDQLLKAVQEQKAYAYKEGNFVPAVTTFEHQNGNDKYIVQENESSLNTYAVCLTQNCAYKVVYDENGKVVGIGDREGRAQFYGDLYGNNHMISAITGQVDHQLIRISWSNLTVSNVILRGNSSPEDKEISNAQDTKSFKGDLVILGSDVHWDYYRLVNVKFEYCILENGVNGFSCRNNDLQLNGCVIRNLLASGITTPQRVCYRDEDKANHPYYSHVKLHNIVFSNTLGSLLVITNEKFAVKPTADGKGEYRFVPGDEEANYKYAIEHFYSKGINCEVEQTGFLEAYNWQDVSNAKLFSTGDDNYDLLIQQASEAVLRFNSAFENYRYVDANNTCWLHVAIVAAGLSFDGTGMYTEVPMPKISLANMEDYYTLDTRTMKVESKDFLGIAAEKLLIGMPFFVYGYPNNAKIMPYSTYTLNAAFIDRMHN